MVARVGALQVELDRTRQEMAKLKAEHEEAMSRG
jgi:uncharacterized small protein (DUF1192 family)